VRDECSVNDRIEELSRRQFLKLSGGIGGGLMLALHLRRCWPRRPSRAIRHLRSWRMPSSASIRTIRSDYAKNPEIGQGIKTVFP